MGNICFVGYVWANVWLVFMRFIDGKGPELTPIIISVCQLMADDCSDSSIVHRPRSRNDVELSLPALV